MLYTAHRGKGAWSASLINSSLEIPGMEMSSADSRVSKASVSSRRPSDSVSKLPHAIFKRVTSQASVSEVSITFLVEVAESNQQQIACFTQKFILVLIAENFEYLSQIRRRIVLKHNGCIHARRKTGVRSDQAFHLFLVTGKNHSKLISIVFHPLEQGLDRFATIRILAGGINQAVSFVDKKHTVEC